MSKKDKDIEKFIKWLKLFYRANKKEKNLILNQILFKDESLYKFLNDLKDIDKNSQEKLYEQLRGQL